jgi:hypothetical protein
MAKLNVGGSSALAKRSKMIAHFRVDESARPALDRDRPPGLSPPIQPNLAARNFLNNELLSLIHLP